MLYWNFEKFHPYCIQKRVSDGSYFIENIHGNIIILLSTTIRWSYKDPFGNGYRFTENTSLNYGRTIPINHICITYWIEIWVHLRNIVCVTICEHFLFMLNLLDKSNFAHKLVRFSICAKKSMPKFQISFCTRKDPLVVLSSQNLTSFHETIFTSQIIDE